MHLKIPMNNLPAAWQPPGTLAADKAKDRAIFLAGDGYAVKTLFPPQSSTATIVTYQ